MIEIRIHELTFDHACLGFLGALQESQTRLLFGSVNEIETNRALRSAADAFLRFHEGD